MGRLARTTNSPGSAAKPRSVSTGSSPGGITARSSRFTQPKFRPSPPPTQGTQAWDRYAFVNNNPVRYNDPTGHDIGPAIMAAGATLMAIGLIMSFIPQLPTAGVIVEIIGAVVTVVGMVVWYAEIAIFTAITHYYFYPQRHSHNHYYSDSQRHSHSHYYSNSHSHSRSHYYSRLPAPLPHPLLLLPPAPLPPPP